MERCIRRHRFGFCHIIKLIIMKGSYNYEEQVELFQDIASNNIALAELTNINLKSVPISIISKAVQELKEEYLQQLEVKEDDQKMISIRITLNMAAREQVTNIDELFVNLTDEINTYYDKTVIEVSKQIPFIKECRYCLKRVSNDCLGLKWHEQKCKNAREKNATTAPQKKNKKKALDTQQKYEERQQKLLKAKEESLSANKLHPEILSQRQSKRQRLRNKKEDKYERKLTQLFSGVRDKQKQKSDGQEGIYEDDHDQILKILEYQLKKDQANPKKIETAFIESFINKKEETLKNKINEEHQESCEFFKQ